MQYYFKFDNCSIKYSYHNRRFSTGYTFLMGISNNRRYICDCILENRPYGHKYWNPFYACRWMPHSCTTQRHHALEGQVCFYRRLFCDAHSANWSKYGLNYIRGLLSIRYCIRVIRKQGPYTYSSYFVIFVYLLGKGLRKVCESTSESTDKTEADATRK